MSPSTARALCRSATMILWPTVVTLTIVRLLFGPDSSAARVIGAILSMLIVLAAIPVIALLTAAIIGDCRAPDAGEAQRWADWGYARGREDALGGADVVPMQRNGRHPEHVPTPRP